MNSEASLAASAPLPTASPRAVITSGLDLVKTGKPEVGR